MTITLYHHPLTPCLGPVLLTVRALGIDGLVTQKEVDLSSGASIRDFPSIDDDGFCLSDSHAIVAYLVNAYGDGDVLYPKDPKKRAKVDQWLHFSSSILYSRLINMTEPLLSKSSKVVSEEVSEQAEAAFRMLQDALGHGPWLCGEDMTLADLCCVSLVATIEVFIGDSNHYPKMSSWVEHCKKHVPGYLDVVEACRQKYITIITSRINS